MKRQAREFAQANAFRIQRSAKKPQNGVIYEEDEEYENDRSTYVAGGKSVLYDRTPRESERSQKAQKPNRRKNRPEE